jgi:hypothetical protein
VLNGPEESKKVQNGIQRVSFAGGSHRTRSYSVVTGDRQRLTQRDPACLCVHICEDGLTSNYLVATLTGIAHASAQGGLPI